MVCPDGSEVVGDGFAARGGAVLRLDRNPMGSRDVWRVLLGGKVFPPDGEGREGVEVLEAGGVGVGVVVGVQWWLLCEGGGAGAPRLVAEMPFRQRSVEGAALYFFPHMEKGREKSISPGSAVRVMHFPEVVANLPDKRFE